MTREPGTRSVRRLLIGRLEDVTYWFLDCPETPLLKQAGRSYYERMTAPVTAAWVMRFDQPVLRDAGAQWFVPLVARMAKGETLDLDAVLAARARARIKDAPVIDSIEWSVGGATPE